MAALTETARQPRRPAPGPNWAYRRRGAANLFRMGHCAPTRCGRSWTSLSPEKEWLVRLSAGMPGGIGNTGHECGAFTSPLAVMGLQADLRELDRGLPVIFDRGHALRDTFVACHGTLQCKEIRGNDHFPRHCIAPVLRSAELWRDELDGPRPDAIPEPRARATRGCTRTSPANDFHCAQAVLADLGYTRAETPRGSSMRRRRSSAGRCSRAGPAVRSRRASWRWA